MWCQPNSRKLCSSIHYMAHSRQFTSGVRSLPQNLDSSLQPVSSPYQTSLLPCKQVSAIKYPITTKRDTHLNVAERSGGAGGAIPPFVRRKVLRKSSQLSEANTNLKVSQTARQETCRCSSRLPLIFFDSKHPCWFAVVRSQGKTYRGGSCWISSMTTVCLVQLIVSVRSPCSHKNPCRRLSTAGAAVDRVLMISILGVMELWKSESNVRASLLSPLHWRAQ